MLVSVCTKYNEPMLLHATVYICQQDKYKVDVCMQRFAIRLSKEELICIAMKCFGISCK